MPYDPNKHHRRSIRLRGYDYSTTGAYFVTICVEQRRCLFGDVIDEAIQLHKAGQMIQHMWQQMPQRFPMIMLDTFVVMPNHFHAIVHLESQPYLDTSGTTPPTRTTLGDVLGAFKSLTTNAYVRGVHHENWPQFDRRLWQRTYWDRIIRNDSELRNVRAYIERNPAQWLADRLHPALPSD